MFHLLFITLLSTTIISSLQCAEQPVSKKIGFFRTKSKKSLSLSSVDNINTNIKNKNADNTQTELPQKSILKKRTKPSISIVPTISSAIISTTYNKIDLYSSLIKAINNNDFNEIQFQLNNPLEDPNAQDINGNTGLHLATKKNNFLMMSLLLEHARTNPTILNNDKKIPYDLIPTPDDNAPDKKKIQAKETRHIFSLKAQIHIVTKTICENLLGQNPQIRMTSQLMQKTINTIISKINIEEKKQDNDYTNQFIQNKIFYILEELKKTILPKNSCSIL